MLNNIYPKTILQSIGLLILLSFVTAPILFIAKNETISDIESLTIVLTYYLKV